MIRPWIFLLVVGTLTPTASAQEWAQKMFEVRSHDFGTVARGSDTVYEFVLTNLYKDDVHIAGVRASCGCTTPSITKDRLKSWEKGSIRAKFNTRSFVGAKSATITVVIDEPYYAEVQLNVKGHIRQDVVLNPGSVEFGSVDLGSITERTIDVEYAGRSDWQITDVRSANSNLEVELLDERRAAGRVNYRMLVRLLPGSRPGYFNDELVLVTDDNNMRRVSMPVVGRVVSPLSVSSSLSIGVVPRGRSISKNLVVKANKPFRIVNIDCGDDCFTFKVSDASKRVHVIPVTFTGDATGKLRSKICVQTDLEGGLQCECLATATVTD